MISLKWSWILYFRVNLVHWSCVLALGNIFFISAHSLQTTSIGDRQTRQAPAEEPIPEQCKPFVNVSNNQFFSPGYPADTYTNNTSCIVVLKAPPGHLIKLDFRDWFEIEQSPDCKNDFLEVRDGSHGFNGLLYQPFCGINSFPPMITSSDRYLWVHFKSDENIEYRGFKAVFEFIPRPSDQTTPELIPCYMNHTQEEEGEFGKFNIDNDTLNFYTDNSMPIDCLWSIIVKDNWRVYLQFSEFNLEKPNDCHSNFVQVFSDRTDMSTEYKEFCGSIADSVLSKGSKMFVRFFSESKSNKTLFRANFTAFRDLGTGKDLKCEKNEFYCEDATCIHEDLKCNKKFNCRFRWDEDDCQNAQSITWSGDHIIIIMVIFSLILTGMCLTFIYNCITKLIKDHRTIQEYIRQSREQQLNELEKPACKPRPPSSAGGRSRGSPSPDSGGARATDAAAQCHVPGGDLLPILLRGDRGVGGNGPANGDAYNANIYTVDDECLPETCESACQTRDSLFMTHGYSSGNSSPASRTSAALTGSPPAPFSTFGYKKEGKFKAEARIEMAPEAYGVGGRGRPYSVQTTKSAPDVIVTH